MILLRDNDETLPSTHEGIYAACRYVVTLSGKGEGLYDTLKMELEQSVGRLAHDLGGSTAGAMEWIMELVGTCRWFEAQVVSSKTLQCLVPTMIYHI